MQTQKSVALLAAGRISSSFLTRTPKLVERMGPIASTSLRLASRFSNLLNAGHPVDEMTAVGECGTILISAAEPEFFIDWILREPSIEGKGKAALLCDANAGSEALQRLKDAGFAVASLTVVEGTDDKIFIAEGCTAALKAARELVEPMGARLLRIDAGQKALYEAGVSFAASLALPLVTATAETFRASGLGPNQAMELTERLFHRTLRAYRKAGRNGWEGAVPSSDRESVRRHWQALLTANPALANYYMEHAELALSMFRLDAGWLQDVVRKANTAALAAGA